MNRIFFLPIFVLALTVPPTQVWAQQARSDYHGPHMMWESGWMFFGPLMMVVFIAVIVVVVVLLLRWLISATSLGVATVEDSTTACIGIRQGHGGLSLHKN